MMQIFYWATIIICSLGVIRVLVSPYTGFLNMIADFFLLDLLFGFICWAVELLKDH